MKYLSQYDSLLFLTDPAILAHFLPSHFQAASHARSAKMRSVATGAARYACLRACVCLSAGNNREPYEQRLNRSRCRLGLDSGGPKEPYTRGKPGSFQGKAILWDALPCDAVFRQNSLPTYCPSFVFNSVVRNSVAAAGSAQHAQSLAAASQESGISKYGFYAVF